MTSVIPNSQPPTPNPPAKPVPVADAESKPYFDGAREGKLMLMHCRACGTWRMPSRDRCDACWSLDTEWAQASGRGTVYTFGIMHQLYNPGFAAEIPYNVAVVELEEGPRLTTNIIGCPNDQIRVDMPVEVVFEPAGADVAIPKFRPRTP